MEGMESHFQVLRMRYCRNAHVHAVLHIFNYAFMITKEQEKKLFYKIHIWVGISWLVLLGMIVLVGLLAHNL